MIHDEPERDPLAGARATLRALREAPTSEHVVTLLQLVDGNHARAALLALGLDSLEQRGQLERPAEGEPSINNDMPADPFDDDDWLTQGATTFSALADLSPAGLYVGLRALSQAQLRAVVTHRVLDEMAWREMARREREAPEGS